MSLLAGVPPKGEVDCGKAVCSCFGVGENTIKQAIRKGANSVEAIGKALNAGTNCGSCIPEIRALLDKTKA
jgi:assimilatory nitrate reductase catalytic subunit